MVVTCQSGQLSPRRCVPESYQLIETGGSQPLAVRTETDVRDGCRVAEGEHCIPRRRVPYPHGLFEIGSRPPLGVGAEAEPVHLQRLSLTGEDFLARTRVPQPYQIPLATSGQPLTVRAEADVVLVSALFGRIIPPIPLDCQRVGACCHIPHMHGPVRAGGEQPLPVRAKTESMPDSTKCVLGSAEPKDLLSSLGIPQPDH